MAGIDRCGNSRLHRDSTPGPPRPQRDATLITLPCMWWVRKSRPLCALEPCRQVHSQLIHRDQPSYMSSILKVGGLHNMHKGATKMILCASQRCVTQAEDKHSCHKSLGNSAFILSLIFINATYKRKLW